MPARLCNSCAGWYYDHSDGQLPAAETPSLQTSDFTAGYGEGLLTSLPPITQALGSLQPGEVAYFNYTVLPNNTQGIVVSFDNDGGHAVVVITQGAWPTVQNYDFPIR